MGSNTVKQQEVIAGGFLLLFAIFLVVFLSVFSNNGDQTEKSIADCNNYGVDLAHGGGITEEFTPLPCTP